MIPADRLQAKRDRTLREELLADKDVKFALARVDKELSGYGFISRRRLLVEALRLTRTMAPEVADALASCRESLGYDAPIEVYVRPDPMINACAMLGANGLSIIVLSSRTIEVLSPAELRFVMGHEMGHLAFGHMKLPMPVTAVIEDAAGVIVPRKTSLKLYLWSRAAELSADRAGLVCGRDPEAAASGFFKLASGLSSAHVRPDLEAYAAQVASLASAPAAREKPRDDDDSLDCFSTHPYSPVRVRAIVAFSKSRTYAEATGRPDEGLSDDEIEAIVDRDLDEMNPSYLEQTTESSALLRRLLFCAGLSVAAAHGEIEDSEVKALSVLLGTENTARQPTIEEARAELETKLAEAKAKAPLADRARLVQHLTIIAAADGNVAVEELTEIHRIAMALDVPADIVLHTLRAAAQPLD